MGNDATLTLEDAKAVVRERELFVIQERDPTTGGWEKSGTGIYLGISDARAALEKKKREKENAGFDPDRMLRLLPKHVADTYIAGRRDEAMIRESGSVWDSAPEER